jgi:hypothetical protein
LSYVDYLSSNGYVPPGARVQPKKKPPFTAAFIDGSDGARTRDLRRDRPAL